MEPYSAQPAENPYPARDIQALQRGEYDLDLSRIFSKSWELFLANAGHYIGAATLYFFAVIALLACTLLVGVFAIWVVHAGMTLYTLELLRGRKPNFDTMWAGFQKFWPLVIFGMITIFGLTFGFVLCLVPGIYLAVAWTFALPLIMDRNLDPIEALSLSTKVVNANFWLVFLLVLLLSLLSTGGGAVLIGFLVTQPLTTILRTVAYAEVFGLESTTSIQQPYSMASTSDPLGDL